MKGSLKNPSSLQTESKQPEKGLAGDTSSFHHFANRCFKKYNTARLPIYDIGKHSEGHTCRQAPEQDHCIEGAESRLSARQSLLKKTVCFIQDLSLQDDVRRSHTRQRFSSAVQGHHNPIHSELICKWVQQGKEHCHQGRQRGQD